MSEGFIEKTQQELGTIITAPKLTEKLLARPPFRFLHDIVTSFIAKTGFPDGLYPPDLLDSAKVNTKETKMQFLELLIKAIEAATGSACLAKPQKIVAGAEPESTNQLLQLLAACAGLPDAKKAAAVASAKGERKAGVGGAPAPVPAPAPPDSPELKKKPHSSRSRQPQESVNVAVAGDAASRKERRLPNEAEDKQRQRQKQEEQRKHHPGETEPPREQLEVADEAFEKAAPPLQQAEPVRRHHHGSPSGTTERQSQQQTVTAGKAPPKTKPTHEVMAASNASAATPANSIIMESKLDEKKKLEKDTSSDDENWLKVAEQCEARPAPTSFAGGTEDVDVKGRLGQKAMKAKQSQDEARMMPKAAAAQSALNGEGIIIRGGNRTGMRALAPGSGALMSEGELGKLREQLQLLTKASNPLGKFLEAIHDDIDSMTRELETWRSEARNQALAAADAQRQTEESVRAVQAQLQNVEDAISDQISKTSHLQQMILTNDQAIQLMIHMVIGPDIMTE